MEGKADGLHGSATNIFSWRAVFWLTPEISRTEEEDLEAVAFNNHIRSIPKDFNALAKARDFLREELNSDA